jgi:hypothetical protein
MTDAPKQHKTITLNSSMDHSNITEEREPLDTQAMLTSGFLKNLKKGTLEKIEKSKPNDDATILPGPIVPENVNTEELLLALFDVRDGLIQAFGGVEFNSTMANGLSDNINKISSCIRKLGASVETFNPLNHISGLKTPDLVKNAERVIETTKACYSLGNVRDGVTDNTGKTITITFVGEQGAVQYEARGKITANASWTGNEAIDYIYTPGEGQMFVKAFESKGWVDKSKNYVVAWELKEMTPVKAEEDGASLEGQDDIGKKACTKEEVVKKNQNKLNNDIDDNFPIEEKG